MTGDGVSADLERLRQLADQLRESTTQLAGAAHSVPPMPEVTTSGGKVGDTVSELLKSTAAFMASVADTADKVDASDGSYGETDNRNAESLKAQPRFTH